MSFLFALRDRCFSKTFSSPDIGHVWLFWMRVYKSYDAVLGVIRDGFHGHRISHLQEVENPTIASASFCVRAQFGEGHGPRQYAIEQTPKIGLVNASRMTRRRYTSVRSIMTTSE